MNIRDIFQKHVKYSYAKIVKEKHAYWNTEDFLTTGYCTFPLWELQDMVSSAKLNMLLIFIHEKHKRIIQVDNTPPLLLPSISSGQLHKHRIITLSDLTINKAAKIFTC